jgi:hypothetical protein
MRKKALWGIFLCSIMLGLPVLALTIGDVAFMIADCEQVDIRSGDRKVVMSLLHYTRAAQALGIWLTSVGGSMGNIQCDQKARKLTMGVAASKEKPFEIKINVGKKKVCQIQDNGTNILSSLFY